MTKVYPIIFFLAYVALSCYGLFLIKAATHWQTFSFVFGFFLYALGAVIWLLILRNFPLSFAFPVAAGSLAVGTMLIGGFFLGETIPLLHVIGATMICFGIFLISTSR